jgi:hypothetical protein
VLWPPDKVDYTCGTSPAAIPSLRSRLASERPVQPSLRIDSKQPSSRRKRVSTRGRQRARVVERNLYDETRRCYASTMSTELSASLTSLAGVLLGGTISYVVQHFTQRSADRAEARRQRIARSEARYAERVAIIDRFLVDAQDAERVAYDHHSRGADNADWQRTADAAMDRLYVSEKMVRVLCRDTAKS